MFRWCSYCQSFLGESEPKSDFSLTHGICRQCKAKVRTITDQEIGSIEKVKNFFEKLRTSLINMQRFDHRKVLQEARQLKIDPADLLAGVMQPLLYDIGKLYEEGVIPAVQEHQFSMMIRELIRDIRLDMAMNGNTESDYEADVLLACANGNYHEFGISLLELHLKKAGVSVQIIYPGLPSDQLIEYAKRMKVKVIGLSVSLIEQYAEVAEVARLIKLEKDFHPQLIVGGFVVRDQTPHIEGATFFTGSIEQLVEWIVHEIDAKKQSNISHIS